MSLVKTIIQWFKPKPVKKQAATHIHVRNTGSVSAHGAGSYANSGVSVVSSRGDVIMTGSRVTIRGQVGPVNINGQVYDRGDPLPEGVDITWR